jgi:hypothetical protein
VFNAHREFLENIAVFGEQIFAIGFRRSVFRFHNARCLSVTQIRWQDDGTRERYAAAAGF